MNKVNKILIGIVVILGLLVIVMGSYIIYDKVMYKDMKKDNNNILDNNNDVNDIVDDNNNDVSIDILNSSDVDDAIKIVRGVTKKYLDYEYSLGIYCGEFDRDSYFTTGSSETRDFRQYSASKQFNNLFELKEYYKSIMVGELIPKYITEAVVDGVSFIERDGKLYCQLSGKGCGLQYNEDDSYYMIDSISENIIVSSVIIVSNECGGLQSQSRGNVTLVKDDSGNWLMSKYDVDVINRIFYGE